MRYLLPALLASLVALCGLAGTADAQIVTNTPTRSGCDPRPQLHVLYEADGWVTVSVEQTALRPDNVITNLAIHATTEGWPIAVDTSTLKGLQPNPTVNLNYLQAGGNQAYFRVQIHVLYQAGGAAHVPITVTDMCGDRPSFIGSGGSWMIPYATMTSTSTRTPSPTSTPTFIPTSTPTRTPTVTPSPTRTFTPIPSATLVPTVTATPNASHIEVSPSVVRAGDVFQAVWSGVGAPTNTDWFGLYRQGTADAAWIGAQLYTSSCTTTPGAVVRASGNCVARTSTDTATGYYELRLFRGSGAGNRIATSGVLELRANLAAVSGEGQLFGTRYEGNDPGVCGCEPDGSAVGYVGVQGALNEPYLPYGGPRLSAQLGVTKEFYESLFAQGYAEAGIIRACNEPYSTFICDAFPYASWESRIGIGQTVIWDGFARPAVHLSPYEHYQMSVVQSGGTTWKMRMCGSQEYPAACCDLWWAGAWCTAFPTDVGPALLLDGFPRIFCGQESTTRNNPGGENFCGSLYYCCNQMPYWDRWNCYDPIVWSTYNTLRVLPNGSFGPAYVGWSVGPCTGAGWPVRSWALPIPQ